MTGPEKPLVSVRLKTFNHEKYISMALEGILIQKVDFPMEVVVGDDLSTDGNLKILEGYRAEYPDLIRILPTEKKVGMVPNGIRTWKACSGKYIANLDGDDYWTDPYKLHQQVDILEKNPGFVMCFHNMEVRYEDPSIPSRLYCGKLKKLVHTKYDLAMKNFIPSSGILFRNGLFDDFPEWYARLPFTDWALNMMISQYGDFYCIPKVMGVYRIHGEGVWSRLSAEEGQRQSLQVLEAFIDNFRDDAQLASALEKSKAERQKLLQSGVAEPKMERSIRTKTINSLIHFLNKLK